MERRSFLNSGIAAGAAAASTSDAIAQSGTKSSGKHRFKLKYAPHFGMFKENAGPDHIDQLQFMADQGFTALEDNGMMNRTVEVSMRTRTVLTASMMITVLLTLLLSAAPAAASGSSCRLNSSGPARGELAN